MWRPPRTDPENRPDRRGARGLLLAEDLLGLPDEGAGPGGEAGAGAADDQPADGARDAGLGLAAALDRGHVHAPQPRGPPRRPPARRPRLRHALPGHQPRHLLHRRHGRLLLGLQRGRDRLRQTLDPAPADPPREGVGGSCRCKLGLWVGVWELGAVRSGPDRIRMDRGGAILELL